MIQHLIVSFFEQRENHGQKDIINATLELESENGLGTVSMQQITDKVGITKTSLYNHYSSRDQIVEAMYDFLREASKQRAGLSKDEKMMQDFINEFCRLYEAGGD